MDERSLVLFTKIVVLLIVFAVYYQLVSEYNFQSAAQDVPIGAPSPNDNVASAVPISAPSPNYNVASPQLTDKEVNTFSRIKSSLGLAPYFVPNCDEDLSKSSVIIRCNISETDERHITEILMSDVNLTGEIPEDLAELKYLQELDLSNNKLHGSIPENLGDLSNLTKLDLSQNQLTREIPQNLNNLKNTQYLDLSENQLRGEIPPSLRNLKNLSELYLHQNLLSGPIPATLGSLSSLEILSLWCNQLSSDIPSELGNLSKLQKLILDENKLTGNLPRQLGNLRDLQYLWLGSNKLQGELPWDYVKLKNLQIFAVGGNSLSGAIPKYIANWVNLTHLNLMGNNFTRELPSEIFNMSNLENLVVTGLKNPGLTFPKSANLTNIYTLILSDCNINGEIPSYIANWTSTSLQNLDLSFNNLTGEVPIGLKDEVLDRLFLTGNNLWGKFPTWIYNTVEILGDLSCNNFTFGGEPQNEPRNRTFPEEIMQNCRDKKSMNHSLYINAGGEEITIGRNHYEADNSTRRFYVSPARNWAYSCTGDFYDENTNSSDFIANQKCGFSVNSKEAPLYSKARLCPQSLIYYGFCLDNGLYNVTLHFSEIIFSKDEDLSSSGNRVFDIYIQRELKAKDFNIKGKGGIPNKTLSESFTVDIVDNPLEIKLFWDGKGSLSSPNPLNGPLISAISVIQNQKDGLSKIEIVGIVFGAAVLAMLLLLALMWRMGWLGDRDLRVNKVMLNGKSYTIKQVKDVTRNFSTRNKIGEGCFAIVYKAELPDQIVAVKKLSSQSKQEIDQIGMEVYALKQLDENDKVVKLLDSYSKKDLHLLIYEYMEKGSLQHALFDRNFDMELDWPTRIGICLGIAKGLKYLHEDKKSCKIVHRNIKPSNILLDGNFNAKVADFGLAKLYDEENPYKFIQEKGTAIYMAPDYAMRKAITDKVDVYSFGIVLLETVSRQTNAKYDRNQETVFLLDKAIVLNAKGSLFDLVDTKMPIDRDVRKQAIEVLVLAIKCVDQSPTLRPTMSEVVSVLEKISNINTCSVSINLEASES